jgi:hypothetical protein
MISDAITQKVEAVLRGKITLSQVATDYSVAEAAATGIAILYLADWKPRRGLKGILERLIRDPGLPAGANYPEHDDSGKWFWGKCGSAPVVASRRMGLHTTVNHGTRCISRRRPPSKPSKPTRSTASARVSSITRPWPRSPLSCRHRQPRLAPRASRNFAMPSWPNPDSPVSSPACSWAPQTGQISSPPTNDSPV